MHGFENTFTRVNQQMTMIGHNAIGKQGVSFTIQLANFIRDNLCYPFFRQPAWTLFPTTVKPRVETTEILLLQFVNLIHLLRATKLRENALLLPLTLFLQFLKH